MTPYYADDLAELWHHDARRVSDVIEPETVDLIVTSPPYFALRSYRDGGEHYDGQLGSEATPAAFIDALIECTADWVKVLRPTGSMFVNLGDKRSQRTQTRRSSHQPGLFPGKFEEFSESWAERSAAGATRMPYQNVINDDGLYVPEKSRMLLPERFAIACVDEGLLARQVIIWSKVNGLPESVTDRCRDSHEYIYHLTRQGRYYAAIDEIREAQQSAGTGRPLSTNIEGSVPTWGLSGTQALKGQRTTDQMNAINPLGKVPGSVWTIPSEPLTVPPELGVDHFAAFPSELPRRCILGWSPPGYCLECGQARRPVVEKERVKPPTHGNGSITGNRNGGPDERQWDGLPRFNTTATIVGYACDCPTPDAPTRPAVVLDPFAGTGTTIAVAKALGRKGIGIDLSRDYLRLAEWRINDPQLRRKVLERTGIKVPRPPAHDGQEALFT